jgi:hypothetical protein
VTLEQVPDCGIVAMFSCFADSKQTVFGRDRTLTNRIVRTHRSVSPATMKCHSKSPACLGTFLNQMVWKIQKFLQAAIETQYGMRPGFWNRDW